jgi:hypothetical protein
MTSGLAGHNGTTTALTYTVQAERLNREYKKDLCTILKPRSLSF